MKPDPQPGDIVHVRMTVSDIQDSRHGNVAVAFKSNNGPETTECIYVAPSEILAIEPRPLKVGDRVRWKSALCHWQSGILKAIDENQTGWIRDAFGCYSTILLAALTKEP